MNFYGDIDVISRFDFILPSNAKPWFQNIRGDSDLTEDNRIVLSWKVAEENIECIQLGFGTPGERLHWENHVDTVGNFIYIIIGLFLTITVPIILMKTKSEKSKRIKYRILYPALPIFVVLLFWRILTFKLGEIPLETCFQGKCLKIEIISALIILSFIYFILLKFSYLCIDRRGREENSELEEMIKNEKKSKKISNKDKIEIKLKEYELIFRRADQEASVSWSRFNVFLAVNTLLIYLLTRENLLSSILSYSYFFVGISINVLWLFVHLKSLRMIGFYNKMLSYIEKKEFDEHLDFMKNYNELFYRKYQIKIGKDTIKAKWFQRQSIMELMKIFPILFISIDVIIFIKLILL